VRVVQSNAAKTDVRGAVVHYRDEAGTEIAREFIDALEAAIRQIGAWPGVGSTRFADLLGIPELRSFALQRFPYVIFCMERSDCVDVWRVLHGQRDIPSTLRP